MTDATPPAAPADSLSHLLRGKVVAASLGCIGDPDLPIPPKFLEWVTAVEIDAGGGSYTGGGYHRKIAIADVVGGRRERRTFRRNTFVGSCSLLPTDPTLVRDFGVERYFTQASATEVDCVPLPEVLAKNGLANLDYLKTDLEGMDFEVVRSCEAYFPGLHAIQMVRTVRRWLRPAELFAKALIGRSAHVDRR